MEEATKNDWARVSDPGQLFSQPYPPHQWVPFRGRYPDVCEGTRLLEVDSCGQDRVGGQHHFGHKRANLKITSQYGTRKTELCNDYAGGCQGCRPSAY